jgi:CBS domain-containing protein
MRASDVMRHEVVVIREENTVAELCDLFQQHHVHGAPVVDADGLLRGFVSLEDVLFGSMGSSSPSEPGQGTQAPLPPLVRDIMTAPAVSAFEATDVEDLCRLMWKLRIHHVPIVRDGKVVGIVSALDLARAIAEGKIRA